MDQANTTMTDPTTFVFIPGAGLEAWIWDEVVNSLNQSSICVTFPKPTSAQTVLGMDEYVQSALDQIAAHAPSKVIIVAHSLGGVIGLKIAEALGDRVVGFVAVSAAIPKKGSSFFSALPFPQKLIMPLIVRFMGTKPPEDAIRKGYCNDLSNEQTTEVLTRFSPESAKVYSDPSALPPTNVPKIYIKTLQDGEYPQTLQDAMSANLQADQIVTIDAGHLPMLSKPRELATILNDFSQKNSI